MEFASGAAPQANGTRQADTSLIADIAAFWPICAGGAAIAIPTLRHLAEVAWQGTMGPLEFTVSVIAAALLVQAWPIMRAPGAAGSLRIGLPMLALALATYVVGRIAVYLSVEAIAAYAALVATLYCLVGMPGLAAGWFPVLYPVFALPVEPALRPATVGARLLICEGSVAALHALGYAVAGAGQVIFVDSYVLALKDACSGLSSLLTLSAVGMFYVYALRGPQPRYCAAALMAMIVLALAANFTRVVILVLMTHYLGDAVAQSWFHQAAGLAMFLIALLGVILFDRLAWPHFSARRA